ncbi:MAG: GNAT family N-acetyltransferase [Paracoccaceae bacterium]|nr:GNAT family N-acetyltransferase [Paracoccaceae bacterium]
MSARLHLCGAEALGRLDPMVAAFHDETAVESDAAHRRAGLMPLLEGSPYGAVYLIGPERAPVGYLIVTFSWSLEFGGMDATLDEIWIRPAVRGRGMAREALEALIGALRPAGVAAISLEVERGGPAEQLYAGLGFEGRWRLMLMSRRL